VSALPCVFLVALICEDFGGRPRGGPHPDRSVTLILTALWLALAVASRRKLHHGIPALWTRLWWIVLVPLPLFSFFVAVENLLPSKPANDPSVYPFWIFLAGAVAALPLVAYRAFLSPMATRIERVFFMVSCLMVLAFFLLLMGVWRLLDSGEPIYSRKLSVEEVKHRIVRYHQPYQRAVKDALDEAFDHFGAVWHINCHSMSATSGSISGSVLSSSASAASQASRRCSKNASSSSTNTGLAS